MKGGGGGWLTAHCCLPSSQRDCCQRAMPGMWAPLQPPAQAEGRHTASTACRGLAALSRQHMLGTAGELQHQSLQNSASSLPWVPLPKWCGSPLPMGVSFQSVGTPQHSPGEEFIAEPVLLRLTKGVRGPVFHYGEQPLILLFRLHFYMSPSKKYPSYLPPCRFFSTPGKTISLPPWHKWVNHFQGLNLSELIRKKKKERE